MDPEPSNQLPGAATAQPAESLPADDIATNTTGTAGDSMPESDQAVMTQSEPELESESEIEPEALDTDGYDEDTDEPAFSWQASEYVHHHKDMRWYVVLWAIVFVFVVIAAVLKLWLGMVLFVVMGAAIAVYAKKEPRVLNYSLDMSGVTIETKHYPYSMFKSFSVFEDVEWHSIELDPTQRFMPRLTLLFSEENIDEIAEHLMIHLPVHEHRPDLVDNITRRLRF